MRHFRWLICLGLLAAGCRHAAKPLPPQPTPKPIKILSQYQPGSPLVDLLSDLNLTATEVRYRRDLPDDRKSAVYFFEEGDLHVDSAKKEGGAWVLRSIPFFEPKTEPAVVRLKKWDGGVETPDFEDNPGKRMR